MKRYYLNILVIGFALFSMFFGAGNIIFPPYLGLEAGSHWILGFIFYYMADIGLAIVAIFALIKNNGDIFMLTGRIGKIPGKLMVSVIVLCIGPIIAIPRTGASVHEMLVLPHTDSVSPIVTTAIFFAIVLVLTIRESAVVDILGKFLTPLLFIGLLLLIISGIVSPFGDIASEPKIDNIIIAGVNSGYQTMDVLAAMIFGIIVVKSVMEKGYTEPTAKYKAVRASSLVAGFGLLIVYCGLTYLGATASTTYGMDINRSQLIINITDGLLGDAGVLVLGIVVTLACLTTAVALVSSGSDYFSSLSRGRLSYKLLAVVICVFSAVIGNLGIDAIVMLAEPVLSLVYPGALTLIVMGLFSDRISDYTIRGAVLGALAGSLLELLYNYEILQPAFVPHLPLSNFGFGWFIFAVAGGIAGAVIRRVKASLTSSPSTGPLAGSPLYPQLVCDNGDELRVCRLALIVLYRIAEERVYGLQLSSVPRHLYGMSDSPFDPAGSSVVGLGDGRVQLLGHSSQQIYIFHHHDDGVPQIMISFDVGGNSYFVYYVGYIDLQAFFIILLSRQYGSGVLHLVIALIVHARQLIDALHQHVQIEGLHYVVFRAQAYGLLGDRLLSHC